jgi:hypothetical protein
MEYKDYGIHEDSTALGVCFIVSLPGSSATHIGTWSLAQAKAAIREDIKQRACPHTGARKPCASNARIEYCADCNKRMVIPKVLA